LISQKGGKGGKKKVFGGGVAKSQSSCKEKGEKGELLRKGEKKGIGGEARRRRKSGIRRGAELKAWFKKFNFLKSVQSCPEKDKRKKGVIPKRGRLSINNKRKRE